MVTWKFVVEASFCLFISGSLQFLNTVIYFTLFYKVLKLCSFHAVFFAFCCASTILVEAQLCLEFCVSNLLTQKDSGDSLRPYEVTGSKCEHSVKVTIHLHLLPTSECAMHCCTVPAPFCTFMAS
jgi:hypothetical protein